MSKSTVVIKEHEVSNQRALPIAYKLTLGPVRTYVCTCEADKEVVFYSVRNGTYLTADQLSWLFWLGFAALLTCTVLQGKSWQPNSMSSSL